ELLNKSSRVSDIDFRATAHFLRRTIGAFQRPFKEVLLCQMIATLRLYTELTGSRSRKSDKGAKMESTVYKEARTTSRKRGMMKQLFAITPDNLPMDATLEIMSEIAPIVDFIQVREKSLSPLEQDQLIETALLNGIPPQKLIINDRIDLALLHGLNHVHLTERSIPLQRAQIGFPALSFSRSVHSLTQIMAHHLHASYLQIGHIF